MTDSDVFEDVLRTTRDFVRGEVVPLEDEIERTDAVPDRLRSTAADIGLFGWALPEEYGGLGLDMRQDVRLAIELGWTTPAFRSMLGTNNGIAGKALVGFGTDEQKTRWLPALASGDAVASFALTEDGAGSDPGGVRTRAARDTAGGGWVLSGAKRFITNAPRRTSSSCSEMVCRIADRAEGDHRPAVAARGPRPRLPRTADERGRCGLSRGAAGVMG